VGINPVPSSEADAIQRFAIKSTVPLLRQSHEGPVPHGTGTLLSLVDRYFLITARHIFDDMDPLHMVYPESPEVAHHIFTLGLANVYQPEDPRFDVAVIEILDARTIDRLQSRWQFLYPRNIARPSNDGTFFLSGYPSSLTRKGTNWLTGKLLTIYTSRLLEIPENAYKPVDSSLYLFFDYDESAHNLHGLAVKAPELLGASGGSIWEYDRYGARDVWTPENTTKIVGVQSTYRPKEYFRAISWQVVAACLRRIDSRLNLDL